MGALKYYIISLWGGGGPASIADADDALRRGWEVGNWNDAARAPSGVCIHIPEYVYIPFPKFGYVKGMLF